MLNVGERIKAIRKSKGLNMEEFGSLFSPAASKGVVSNWENNYNLPNNKRLKKIAELGGTSVNELIYGKAGDFIHYAHDIYNLLLDEFGPLTQKGKALRYFDEKERAVILLQAVEEVMEIPAVTTKADQAEKANLTKTLLSVGHIENKFFYLYVESVKTNQNLISVLEEQTYDIEGEVKKYATIKGTEKKASVANGTVFVEEREKGISEKLEKELIQLVEQFRTNLENLKIKYPDEQQGTVKNILFIPNGLKNEDDVSWVDIESGKDIHHFENVKQHHVTSMETIIEKIEQGDLDYN